MTGAVARRELPSYEQIPQKLVSDCKLKTNDALAANCSTRSEDEIGALAYKSKEMDIPVIPEQIKVIRAGGHRTGALVTGADYTVHVDLPVYPLELNFHAVTENKGIYWAPKARVI